MPVNFLDNMNAEQRDMIVSLPYRIGLKINQSDEDDGSGTSEQAQAELNALSNLLTAYSQEVFGAETVQYVIGETVKRKAEWSKWANKLEEVEDDCGRAVELVASYVDPKEVSAFRNYLVEIGESVALAFREYNDENTSLFQRMKLYMMYGKCKAQAQKLKKEYMSYEEFLNISLSERTALQNIAKALGTVYI